MKLRLLACVMVAVMGGCSQADRLPALQSEPIMSPPPGAVLLADRETGGSTFGFGSSAKVDRMWAVDGSLADAVAHYLDGYPQYRLRQQGSSDFYIGTRPPDETTETGANVAVRFYPDPGSIAWDRITFVPDDLAVQPAAGSVIVVVGVSSG